MKWHTTLATLVAILFLGISIPIHAEVLSFDKAPKANSLIQKAAQCPGGDCGKNCQLKGWLNANVSDQKVFGRSDCNGYVGTDLLDDCKKAVAAIPEKFTCKRGGKKPPHVADAGKTKPDKKPDKKPATKPADNGKKPDVKPADNGKADNPATKPAPVATACLTKEAIEELAKKLRPNITVDSSRFDSAVDELKARPGAPWGWIIFLLVLNLFLLVYTAWPRLGPALKKLLASPPPPQKK